MKINKTMAYVPYLKSSVRNGYTLIEILLSATLITMVAGILIPVYQSFQVKTGLDIAADTIAQSLRRAQELARASNGDSSWGVYAGNDKITIFKGPGFASRDQTFDEIYNVYSSLNVTGIREVVFAKFSGLPGTSGDIILTSSHNETRGLNVNPMGMVAY